MTIPQDLKFTSEHEWLRLDGQNATVGITTFAADALGDVVFIELPEVGARVSAGQSCGELESTKSVSDLYAPADGEVMEVNDAVVTEPGLLNTDPFGAGWLFRMTITKAPDLLDAGDYEALTRDS